MTETGVLVWFVEAAGFTSLALAAEPGLTLFFVEDDLVRVLLLSEASCKPMREIVR